ncbi:MAG TPA: hypothetical protein VEW69_11395 [Alphaproteobacteria bacterium]|nr:hypothetical protein [Alphaproteobacteria bacterium]
MIFDIALIFLAGAAFLLAAYGVLRHLGRFSNRSAEDVVPYLRPVDLQELEMLLDPALEVSFRMKLSSQEFRQVQRKRARLMQEYLLRMSHNAMVLIEWANQEWSPDRPAIPGSRQELAQALVQAATEFRLYSLLARAKLSLWLVRLELWPLFGSPSLYRLRNVFGIDALGAYHRLKGAACDLSVGHGLEYQTEVTGKF